MLFVLLLKMMECPEAPPLIGEKKKKNQQSESPTGMSPPFPRDYNWVWNQAPVLEAFQQLRPCPDLPVGEPQRAFVPGHRQMMPEVQVRPVEMLLVCGFSLPLGGPRGWI